MSSVPGGNRHRRRTRHGGEDVSSLGGRAWGVGARGGSCSGWTGETVPAFEVPLHLMVPPGATETGVFPIDDELPSSCEGSRQSSGRRAPFVTGGGRGIGAAIVKRLAREGAHVALTYVSKPDHAKEMAKAVQELGVKAIAIQADSADAQAVRAAVERTVGPEFENDSTRLPKAYV